MKDLAPMLACKDASKIRFPLLASPKLDGVRALVKDGVVLSRTLKPIPNKHVQALFGHLHGFDGELCVGPPNASDLMQRTMSGVMRIEGEPDVSYYVFDQFKAAFDPFHTRYQDLHEYLLRHPAGPRVILLEQVAVGDQAELHEYEAARIAEGFEGVMVRDPNGKYKYGRATAKEGYLTKIKRFEDSEAIVVDVEERHHNDNAAELDELGHTKRSTHKANMRPAGDLGALVCRTPEGIEFRIGTGFTAAQRVEFWLARGSLIGRLAKYKHFAVTGVKEAPRFPVFLGFRDARDV